MAMDTETIDRVEVLDTGELLLGIQSQGKAWYQYVYREAAGVYWDQGRRGFKSTEMKEWTCSMWFIHIVDVVNLSAQVRLQLGSNIVWKNIPDQERAEIERSNTI